MLYFTKSELARRYHVSEHAVRHWVKAAGKGELNLVLHTEGDRVYVANTASNIALLDSLAKRGKKYRNTKAVKNLTPSPEFYSIYSQAQIHDILTNLEVRREIPRQYSYLGGGAHAWDEYIERMDKEHAASNLTMTRDLLRRNQGYIDELVAQYDQVNIVDVGVGNALPVRGLLEHLRAQDKLGRYIAIDISPEMLQIAKRNIKEWFDGSVSCEGHELNIARDHFEGILLRNPGPSGPQHVGNLVLFLGGTLQNFGRKDVPLQVINDSMGANDFLLHTQKLDSYHTRRQFDFSSRPGEQLLPPIHSSVVDLLNIGPSLYQLEVGYDEKRSERYERIRLKFSITITFDFQGVERVVAIEKGEAILLWRASQDTALDLMRQFDRNDFSVLQSSQTADEQYILTISRIKRPMV